MSDPIADALPTASNQGPDPAEGLRRQDGAPTDTVMVLTTVPDVLLAKRIAHVLVEESLVACAQIGPQVTSMYLWQGQLEGVDESPLSFKTTAAMLPALHARLCALHPYQIPEFLVFGVPAGSVAYLDWVAGSVGDVVSGPADVQP